LAKIEMLMGVSVGSPFFRMGCKVGYGLLFNEGRNGINFA